MRPCDQPRLERSDSSIPPTTITNKPTCSCFARASVLAHRRNGFFDIGEYADSSKPINQRIEEYKDRIWSGTFHQFASAVIRRYGDDHLNSLRVVSANEQRGMLSEIISKILAGRHFRTFTSNSATPDEAETTETINMDCSCLLGGWG